MTYLEKFRSSKTNHWWNTFLRVLQFLASVISLGLFSARLRKILRLYHRYRAADGAVEGILAAATLYTLSMLAITCCLRHGAPKILRWLQVLLDILFIGAFIAVAVLTRPDGGRAGPNSCNRSRFSSLIPGGENCNLPWGVFILAIISTVLHALTALFHQVRDHHREQKHGRRGTESSDPFVDKNRSSRHPHSTV
ncbi:Uu.00g005830.m01.CDS01 [Anthostomella pinea]|uniref:Uu.00g005830.m01.CDS01 n=1 Tax=Anthostomella pinea TaxID=933095 RepID=A0AAI8YJ25_9PEZI|nr:Uu.00g005830.m01.CDS01 [Anthostomella pinea]